MFEGILDGRIVWSGPECCYFIGLNRFLKVYWTDGSSGRIQNVVISFVSISFWRYSWRADRLDGFKQHVAISCVLIGFWRFSGRTDRLDGSKMMLFHLLFKFFKGILGGRIVRSDPKSSPTSPAHPWPPSKYTQKYTQKYTKSIPEVYGAFPCS